MHFCRLHPLLPAFATKGKWGSPGEQLADSWGQSFYWSAWDRNTIWPRAMPHSHLLLLNYRLLGVVSVRRTSQKINGIHCFSSHLCFKSFRTWQARTETDHVFITSCYGMYYPALWCQVTLGVCVQGSRRHSRDVMEVQSEAVRLPPETWLGSWNQHGVEGKDLEISFQPYYRRLCERGGTWSSARLSCVCAALAPCWMLEADRQNCLVSWQLPEVVPQFGIQLHCGSLTQWHQWVHPVL